MVEPSIARFIAENALNTPFRQVQAQTTSDFMRWLSAAGLRLQDSSVFHLWKIGVIRPIAISKSPENLFDSERFLRFYVPQWLQRLGRRVEHSCFGKALTEADIKLLRSTADTNFFLTSGGILSKLGNSTGCRGFWSQI